MKLAVCAAVSALPAAQMVLYDFSRPKMLFLPTADKRSEDVFDACHPVELRILNCVILRFPFSSWAFARAHLFSFPNIRFPNRDGMIQGFFLPYLSPSFRQSFSY